MGARQRRMGARQGGGSVMTGDEGAGERDLAWLLDDLASRVKDFTRAVIRSRDGLLLAASRDLSREEAEHLSAVAAALQSLATGTGERFHAGGVRQTIMELQPGLLFVIAAGEGSCVAALCAADADAGMVAYEMAMLVKRARPHLISHSRFPVNATAGE